MKGGREGERKRGREREGETETDRKKQRQRKNSYSFLTHHDTFLFPPFQCFSDPTNSLRNWLKDNNMIEVAVMSPEGDVYHEIKKYVHGMVQPAVIVVKPDMTILAKWAQIPSKVIII